MGYIIIGDVTAPNHARTLIDACRIAERAAYTSPAVGRVIMVINEETGEQITTYTTTETGAKETF